MLKVTLLKEHRKQLSSLGSALIVIRLIKSNEKRTSQILVLVTLHLDWESVMDHISLKCQGDGAAVRKSKC